MKLNFLIEHQGAKKHICVIDHTGKPCRLVSSVFVKDRYHPRFGKRKYFAHILSPMISTADMEILMLGLWRRLKSSTPGEKIEIGLAFSVLWQEVVETSPSPEEPSTASQSEQLSPFAPQSGGVIAENPTCTCGNYVARSTSGVIDLACQNCEGSKHTQLIG